jgi:hypothetical protein
VLEVPEGDLRLAQLGVYRVLAVQATGALVGDVWRPRRPYVARSPRLDVRPVLSPTPLRSAPGSLWLWPLVDQPRTAPDGALWSTRRARGAAAYR